MTSDSPDAHDLHQEFEERKIESGGSFDESDPEECVEKSNGSAENSLSSEIKSKRYFYLHKDKLQIDSNLKKWLIEASNWQSIKLFYMHKCHAHKV